MHVMKFKWTFRIQADSNGIKILHKARCVAKGYLRYDYKYLEPEKLYALAASHEGIRILTSFTASEN